VKLAGIVAFALLLCVLPASRAVADDFGCPEGMSQLDCSALFGNWPSWVPDNGSACQSADTGETTVLTGSGNVQQGFNFFVGKGLSDLRAAAIIGNFMQESGMKPDNPQPGGPGRGIAQWSVDGRWVNLVKYAKSNGKNPLDLATQLEFVWLELTNKPPAGDYRTALANLQKQTTIEAATGFFMGTSAVSKPDQAATDFINQYGRVGGYENPGTPELGNRIDYAKQVLNQYGGGAVSGSDGGCTASCTSSGGDTLGLSALRQQVVCLTLAEYELWKSGKLGPGNSKPYDFYKYSQQRDEEWCADFASWIYNQAGYPIDKTATEGNVSAVPKIREIGEQNMEFTYHSAGNYTPVPGDMVIYYYVSDAGTVTGHHVNIVVSTNKKTSSMTVVGGNQDNVLSGADNLSSVSEYIIHGFTGSSIVGYVSPKE
jgi:hypothetical protein